MSINARICSIGLLLLVSGCNGPFWYLPGGSLAGEEAPFTLAAIPSEAQIMQLETRLDDPYSVNVGFVRLGDAIYIDPAEDRTWYQNIAKDPDVRVRFEGSKLVHPATAQRVSEESVLDQFASDRIVLKLVAR